MTHGQAFESLTFQEAITMEILFLILSITAIAVMFYALYSAVTLRSRIP